MKSELHISAALPVSELFMYLFVYFEGWGLIALI